MTVSPPDSDEDRPPEEREGKDAARLSEIRSSIEDGTYETPELLEEAVRRMMSTLRDPPTSRE